MKHECEEQKKYMGHDELEYDLVGNRWDLYLESNCCSIQVIYCPWCGKKMEVE